MKTNLDVICATAGEILAPMGFKRYKHVWRLATKEVLHQFSIVGMNIGKQYRPEWGANLLRLDSNTTPKHYDVHIRWILEMSVKRLPERLGYFAAFDLEAQMPNSTRIKKVHELVTRYVLPSFEATSDEAHVRSMISSYKTSFRAHAYSDLPDEWFPST